MKPTSRFVSFLSWQKSAIAGTVLATLSAAPAFAETIYWDGTGTIWDLAAANWSTAAGADTPDPVAFPAATDDVAFNISTLNTNQAIGMGVANQAALSLTFKSTGTVNLGNGGGNRELAIGSGGITVDSGAGAVMIGSSGSGSNVFVKIAASQTWTNNSASGLTIRNNATGMPTGSDPVTLTLSATSNGTISDSGALNDGLGGAVVTLVVDSSGTGSSNLNGGNFSGGTTIRRGLLSASGTLGTGDILLGDTSGTNDARLHISGTVASDLEVRSGSSGALSITGSGTNNFTGGILLNNNLTVGSLSSSGQTLNISGVISGTGNLTAAKLGTSTPTVVLTGANTFAGTTSIDSAVLVVDSLNRVTGGSASSSLGAAPADATTGTIRMSAVSAGTLRYAGTGEATDRSIEVAGNAGATLQHSGTGLLTFEGDVTMSGTGSRTLTLRGGSENTAEISGAINNIGGGFNTSVTKTDTGTWKLSGLMNTYTGSTSITGGVLEVMTVADGGVASSIGASSNSAGNLTFGGGTLKYLGSGGSTNRIFNVGALGATFDASGTGAVSFTNSTAPTHSTTSTPRTITFTGTNTGDNTMANSIGNGNATGLTSIIKNGDGKWILSGNNTYTGDTTINGGTLSLTIDDLADESTVNVATGAFLHLDHTNTDTVADFKIDGVSQGPGTFHAGNSSGRITGTGSLFVASSSDPFIAWIDSFTSLTDPADKTKDADPDGDGHNNLAEFALNGNPESGSDNGLTALLLQDTTAPAGNELTYIIAVRDGATFAPGTGGVQTASILADGLSYAVQGSLDLVFPGSAVSHVSTTDTAPAATGLGDLTGTAWEYHTFRLDASEGLGSKGFLRVVTQPAP